MLILVLGALAVVFAAALLVLPGIRVLQGTLSPRRAVGLWIAGAGFALLAAAALVVDRDARPAVVVAGVVTAVVGNIVQRRNTR